MQHVKRMRRVLSRVSCAAVPYFSTLSHKRHDFQGEKNVEYKMCVLIFLASFVRNISHSKKNSASVYHKCTKDFTYSTRYFCHILMGLEFSQIFETFWNMKLHKNPCSGSRVFHANGQTDVTKLMVAIRIVAYAPENSFFI